ncbi:MAG: 7,8-didemethyl-8-hydroxy-5-deazariboflavin synthase subunit CofH [Rhodospirillales bacterium]|nr:7,8-didemethyl-8-hydroxy-5-deazariboflavin synthase subunit CofH [Rhodospirillales bacterium]MSP79544.1 7,8-didemethyl-8-hydroxy-5-deazariboflavin synthase subunit CofH [Rhodospirillales bacterium]
MTDLRAAAEGTRLADEALFALAATADTESLLASARRRRDLGHGALVTYSPKVFIPLTKLCRDVCAYCTFAEAPRAGKDPYLSPDEVLAIARAGADAGCREALFTLGDKPELRWAAARESLARLGHPSTLSYLAAMAKLVRDQTGLLPHLNPGVLTEDDCRKLRPVSVSMGAMMENLSARLCAKGGPHHGSPDKQPAARLATLEAAGSARVPFTTGLLVGIGETETERMETLLAIRRAHERFGHVQEIIVQNFRAKARTRMAESPDAAFDAHVRAIALARLAFAPDMSIQAPPNLSPGRLEDLIGAGIDDWGGVSPLTPDYVNPEAPWPDLRELEVRTEACGKTLAPRLAIRPAYVRAATEWLDPETRPAVLRLADADGLARDDWTAGKTEMPPSMPAPALGPSGLAAILARARDGRLLAEAEICALFAARGPEVAAVRREADGLRREAVGDAVTYVVNRNINYTNVCTYRCKFCAFSKGRTAPALRGPAYDLPLAEIERRVREAWLRGATEVCLQGGIHPDYDGHTYLAILAQAKQAAPDIHVHAFSPLEIHHGAATLGLSAAEFLGQLKRSGLGSLPGTAAEILDDEVRAVLCPDKIATARWLEIMAAAHDRGLRTTATIMFGHVDAPEHWARHLIRVRDLQRQTGGFTEFVPLPFVPMEAPIFRKGLSRAGPTFREAVLMHAVARLALNPWIKNIQTSWVKMGPNGAAAALQAGANDLGGTLMNESITRAAGASFGQEMAPQAMAALILGIGRTPRPRTTLYGKPPEERTLRAQGAPPLEEISNTRPARASAA